MGYYINVINGKEPPTRGKAKFILANVPDSKSIPPPTHWEKGLVCVVDNTIFDAAGYAYDPIEMEDFQETRTGRPREWLLVPGADILSGFTKES